MADGDPARERPVSPPPVPPALAALVEGARCHRDLVGEAGAEVYRLVAPDGSASYLKHGTGTVAQDIADEMARLRWLQGRAPVPQVRHFVQEGDSAWLVTAAVPGRTAYQCLEADPAQGPALVDAIAGYLRNLHALPVAACPFNADHQLRLAHAEQRLRDGLIDANDFGDAHAGWSPERLWNKLNGMLPLQAERVVTHGDFSLDNLLIADGRMIGCIDVGRAGIADPYQDLAILWDCLGEFDDALQARLFAAYGIAEPDMHRLDFHLALDECF